MVFACNFQNKDMGRHSSYYSSSTASATASGIGFAGLLTIVFIALKLCGVIDWSWWWVCSPILIQIAIVVIIVAVVLFFAIRE